MDSGESQEKESDFSFYTEVWGNEGKVWYGMVEMWRKFQGFVGSLLSGADSL